jgi:hypothetical protein
MATEARIREMGRHNTTEADKDNPFKRFTWSKALQDRRYAERMTALLRDVNNPVEG